MRVAVTGATGRTGGEVLGEAVDRGHDVVLASARRPPEAPVHGVDVDPADAFPSLVESREPNVVVDFTGPDATVEYAAAAADAGVAFVTGTTGLDDDQQATLEAASDSIPVLQAANFARGVQALLAVVEDAVAALPGYDVELVETHHNGKRDAPSGTATEVLDRVAAARSDDDGDDAPRRVHGRQGEARRESGEIGVHSLRAGDVPGEHEVVLADNHEELRLTHRATDRGVFAAGALDAAEWLSDQDAGWYDFADVIGSDDGDADGGDEGTDETGDGPGDGSTAGTGTSTPRRDGGDGE